VKYFARSFGRIQADGDARGGGRNRVAGDQENQNKKTSAGKALHGPAFLLNRFSTGNIPACLDDRHELRAVQSDQCITSPSPELMALCQLASLSKTLKSCWRSQYGLTNSGNGRTEEGAAQPEAKQQECIAG
jgi:hypothetical protein